MDSPDPDAACQIGQMLSLLPRAGAEGARSGARSFLAQIVVGPRSDQRGTDVFHGVSCSFFLALGSTVAEDRSV